MTTLDMPTPTSSNSPPGSLLSRIAPKPGNFVIYVQLLVVLWIVLISPTSATEIEPQLAFEELEEGPGGPSEHGKPGECALLGPFSLIVQGALGGMAAMSLVYKRWRERPQRPLKVWFFDVSKQVVGSVLLHIANLLMSMLSSGGLPIDPPPTLIDDDHPPNPCSFYLLNLAIDTTIGIPILVGLLRLFTWGFSKTPLGNPPESIKSGNYGRPPRAMWWFKQCIIYFLGLLGMKFVVLIIFTVCPWIGRVGDWALGWTEGNEKLQIFFVMFFFPVVMNATQYYIIDSFIKDPNSGGDHERIPSVAGDSTDEEDGSTPRIQHTFEDSSDAFPPTPNSADDPERKGTPKVRTREGSTDSAKLDEYDPERDGEAGDKAVEGEDGDRLHAEAPVPEIFTSQGLAETRRA